MKLIKFLVLVGLICIITPQPALAFPFVGPKPTTWRDEARHAQVVVVVYPIQNRQSKQDDTKQTIFQVVKTLKDDEPWNNRDRVVLDIFIAIPDDKPPQAYLLFGDIVKGKIDYYRGVKLAFPEATSEYLRGSLEIDDQDVGRRLNYSFRYLDSPESNVAEEAFGEFFAVSEAERIQAGKRCDAQSIRRLLCTKKVTPHQVGTLLLLLAGCGNIDDVPMIQRFIERMEENPDSVLPRDHPAAPMALNHALIAYITLSSKLGFKEMLRLIADPKKPLLTRCAVLWAIRYFWEIRKDVISSEDLVSAMKVLLDQGDIADLAMDDLRRWQRWEVTDKVIGLYGQESHKFPIVKRAITRFALCALADNKTAAAFLKKRRAEDAEGVAEIEQLLELEKAAKSEPKPEPKK